MIAILVARVENDVALLQQELLGLEPVRALTRFEVQLIRFSGEASAVSIQTDWQLLRQRLFGPNGAVQSDVALLDNVDGQVARLKGRPDGPELDPLLGALNEVILSLADLNNLILDPDLLRYHLIDLFTRIVPGALLRLHVSAGNLKEAVSTESLLHSISVPGMPEEIKDAALHFIKAQSKKDAILALDDLSTRLERQTRQQIETSIERNRLSEAVVVFMGVLAVLVVLGLNRALVLKTSAYLDPRGHALRALRVLCLLQILGNLLGAMFWPVIVVRWPYFATIGFDAVAILATMYWRNMSKNTILALTLVAVLLAYFEATVTTMQLVKYGTRFEPFLAFKIVPIVLAIVAPPPALFTLLVILASGMIPVAQYFLLFTPEMRAALPVSEPWAAVFYSIIGLVIFIYRGRETRVERELIQALNEKKAAEKLLRSEGLFRSMFEHSPVGIIVRDIVGTDYRTNPSIQRMLGYTGEELARLGALGVTHPEDFAKSEALLKKVIAGEMEGYRLEKRYVRKDGSVLWADVSASVVRDSSRRPVITVGVIVDITERKWAEGARKEAERERERLLATETRAREEAEKTLRLREDFLVMASHELRTPLTPLKLQFSIVRRLAASGGVWSSPEGPRILKVLESSEQQLDRIARTVETMIITSKIGAGELELNRETCDLSTIIRGVLDRSESELIDAHCPLKLDLPAGLWGSWDRAMLDKAVGSLVENAIKFGRGRAIEISATVIGHDAKLTVRDHGIGLKSPAPSELFGRFAKGKLEDSAGGFGLGLYVARSIVEAHGGRIHGENAPGGGALFTIELPTALARELMAI